MRRRTMLAIFAAPIALPLVLSMTAAMAISMASLSGGNSSANLPAAGAVGGDLRAGLDIPPAIEGLLTAAVKATGSPYPTVSVFAAQIYQESHLNPNAKSSMNAMGIAQFIPATWATWGMDGNGDGKISVWDPADALFSAARYDAALATQVANIKGTDTTSLMLAAYNAGPGAVKAFQGVPPYAETQAYVQTITMLARQWGTTPGQIGDGSGGVPAAGVQQVQSTGNKIIDTAVAWAVGQIDSWYHFGGTCTDPFGSSIAGHCDCSSLMQQAYAHAGVALPRTAAEQSKIGDPVAPGAIQPGDLVATVGADGTRDRPGHIAMYIGNGYVVEAPYEGVQVHLLPVRSYHDIVAIRRIVTG